MLIDRDILKFNFLQSCELGQIQRIPIKGDASYRKYERILTSNNSYIFMDAPPEFEEVTSFIKVTGFLRDKGLSAPKIFKIDVENGFLLLEDFGDKLYTNLLSNEKETLKSNGLETDLYEKAIDALIYLHKQSVSDINLPLYDELTLIKESLRFIEWYVEVLNGEKISKELQEEFVVILKHLLSTTKIHNNVVVLRDYHASNIIWLESREGYRKAGLLDYQDAVIGSPVYDIVSLLEDARRDVSSNVSELMITRYLKEFPEYTRKDFMADFAIYGIQRNLKIVGFCAAQAAKNKNPFYLTLLPRVWKYIHNDLKHPLLLPLKSWLMKVIPTQMNKMK